MAQRIKVKDWRGIVTNVDENDSRLEVVRDATNFEFKQGYVRFESRNLSELTLPNLAVEWPGWDWEWETGIYTTLVGEVLNDVEIVGTYEILVLVAKALVAGVYHRLVFLQDPVEGWIELSKNSPYGTAEGIRIVNWDNGINADTFDNSFFSTDVDGKAFFQEERGRLKLFLPHDAFKIQWVNRRPLLNYLNHSAWYIDRLTEPFDKNNLTVKVDGESVNTVQAGTPVADVTVGEDRRLGFKFTTSIVEDGLFNEEELSLSAFALEGAGVFAFGKYEISDSLGQPIQQPSPPPTQQNLMDDWPDKWYFFLKWQVGAPGWDTGNFIIPEVYANELEPQGTTWAAIATFGEHYTYMMAGGGWTGWKIKNSWAISRTNFEAQTWLRTAGNDVPSAGWETATDRYNYSIIVTAVLDEREELIIEKYDGKVIFAGVAPDAFAIKIDDIYIPIDSNKRITRIRLYHKFTDLDTDYTLHKEINLLTDEDPYNTSFMIGEYTDTGTTLAGNIGFLVNHERMEQYNPISGFRSLSTVAGVSIGLRNADISNAYHSIIAGGNTMVDLFYSATRLDVTGLTDVRAVCDINGKIGVFTDSKLFVITVGEVLGQLTFEINDTLDLGVKNNNDVISVQGGAVINTRNGLFFTNGFDSQPMSIEINNIVKDNFGTSSIYYNRHKNELYYKPTGSEDLYRFRFEDKVWEKINATITEEEIVAETEAVS